MLSNVRCFSQWIHTNFTFLFVFTFECRVVFNAVFKVLVGLRAEKQRDSGQEPNLTVA